MTISTSWPSLLMNRRSRSVERPSSFPRSSAETLGWSMPSKEAACFCVSLRSVSSCEIRIARSAFASSSSGLGKPKSAKTFPLLGSASGRLFVFFLLTDPFRILFLRYLEPSLDELDFVLRRFDTCLRPVRTSLVVLDDFQDPG